MNAGAVLSRAAHAGFQQVRPGEVSIEQPAACDFAKRQSLHAIDCGNFLHDQMRLRNIN
jgi:hypothetical protein